MSVSPVETNTCKPISLSLTGLFMKASKGKSY